MVRCLGCKKYLEIWDGKPPYSLDRFNTNIYSNLQSYDYYIVVEYKPKTIIQTIANLFKRKRWEIIGGITIWAHDYASAYVDSAIEIVDIFNTKKGIVFNGILFISHISHFSDKETIQEFNKTIDSFKRRTETNHIMLQCTSCWGVFPIKDSIKFWRKREDYYGDLPLCACGGEIINDVIVSQNKVKTCFRCDKCETDYNKSKFENVVDLADN